MMAHPNAAQKHDPVAHSPLNHVVFNLFCTLQPKISAVEFENSHL